MDGGDAVLVGELAHKTKPADTASETSSLPEQKGFRGFVLLDTQDFTGEPKSPSGFSTIERFEPSGTRNTASGGSRLLTLCGPSTMKRIIKSVVTIGST